MKRGCKSFKSIQKWYHEIDRIDEYVLFEHNLDKSGGWFRFAVIH